MDLQISGVTGADFAPVDVRASLADADAAYDHPISLGDSNPPPLTLEAVEREEAGPAVDAKADVADHWAGRGQSNQTVVVREPSVTNDKTVARSVDVWRVDFERGDWCSQRRRHFTIRQMTMRACRQLLSPRIALRPASSSSTTTLRNRSGISVCPTKFRKQKRALGLATRTTCSNS